MFKNYVRTKGVSTEPVSLTRPDSSNYEPLVLRENGTTLPIIVHDSTYSSEMLNLMYHQGTLNGNLPNVRITPTIAPDGCDVVEVATGKDSPYSVDPLNLYVIKALFRGDHVTIPSDCLESDKAFQSVSPLLAHSVDRSIEEVRSDQDGGRLARSEIALDLATILGPEILNAVDGGQKWDHQPLSIKALFKHLLTHPDSPNCTITSATGTGKTRIEQSIVSSAIQAGYRHVIHVSPQLSQLRQSLNAFETASEEELGADCARWYGKEKDPIDKDTALIFTTYDSYEKLLLQMEKQGRKPPLVIFDEAHHLNRNRQRILENPQAANAIKIGFTATPGRSPNSLEERGLPVIFEFPVSEGIRRGVLAPIKASMYKFNPAPSNRGKLDNIRSGDGGKVTNRYIEELMEKDKGYVSAVVQVALNECSSAYEDGNEVRRDILKPTIIEAFSKSQAEEILKEIIEEGNLTPEALSQVAILTSDNTDERNQEILEYAASGMVNWIISVNMMVEGVNFPRYSTIIMRPRPYSETQHDQALGRVLRYMDGKIARVIQLFDTDEPELIGYRTIRSMLGIIDLDPDTLYTGDAIEYNRSVATKRQSPKKSDIPDQLRRTRATYTEIQKVMFDCSEGNHIYLWDLIKDEQMLREMVRFNLRKYQPDYISGAQALKYLNPVTIVGRSDGSYEWKLDPKRVEELLGVRLEKLEKRFKMVNLIQLIAEIESEMNVPSLYLACQSPSTFVTHLFRLINNGELQHGRLDVSEISSIIRASMTALDPLISAWSSCGLLPPEVTSLRGAINYAFLLYNFDTNAANVPFALEIDRSRFPTVPELLTAVEEAFIKGIAQKIATSYKELGYYLRPSKYNTERYINMYGIDQENSRKFIESLRIPARTLIKNSGYQMSSVSSLKFFSSMVEKAEIYARDHYGVKIESRPFEEGLGVDGINYGRAFRFLYERADSHVKNVGSFVDFPIGLSTDEENDLRFEKIFGIRVGELKRLCRSWNTTPSHLLQKIIAQVDKKYGLSYNMYIAPNKWENSAQLVADYIGANAPTVKAVTSRNIDTHGPRLPKKEGIGLTTPGVAHDTSFGFAQYCKDRGISPAQFCVAVNRHLKQL